VPAHHWDDLSNQRAKLDDVCCHLGLKTIQDWLDVSKRKLVDARAAGLLELLVQLFFDPYSNFFICSDMGRDYNYYNICFHMAILQVFDSQTGLFRLRANY
jgi:hypothetical protein